MKLLLKWFSFIILALVCQNLFLSFTGIKTNLFFLLMYLFIITYYFPKEQKRNRAPNEFYPLLFCVIIGLIEDLEQGIIGPSIISKSVTGFLLIKLAVRVFFNWNEQFKGAIIFIFTLIDEIIYMTILIYFFNLSVESLVLITEVLIRALLNVPLGLFITWGKP
jgi:hypothetical protein